MKRETGRLREVHEETIDLQGLLHEEDRLVVNPNPRPIQQDGPEGLMMGTKVSVERVGQETIAPVHPVSGREENLPAMTLHSEGAGHPTDHQGIVGYADGRTQRRPPSPRTILWLLPIGDSPAGSTRRLPQGRPERIGPSTEGRHAAILWPERFGSRLAPSASRPPDRELSCDGHPT